MRTARIQPLLRRFPSTCLVAFLVVLSSMGHAGSGDVSAAATVTQTIVPVADAYVTSAKPTTNYGQSPRLRAGFEPFVRSYLRFDRLSVGGTVMRATLRVYATSASVDGYAVHAVADTTWQESAITSANAPAASPTPVASSGPLTARAWSSVDVTSLVVAGGLVTIALMPGGSTDVTLGSRESGSKRPMIVVEAVAPDTEPPTAPGGLAVTSKTATSVDVSWSTSTDNVGVTGYGLYRDGTLVGSTAQTSYTFQGLSCGTAYTLGVDAYDAAGRRSSAASVTVATTSCPDAQPPTAPTDLRAESSTQTSVSMSWSPSTDNVGVVGYRVYRNGVPAGSSGTTAYTLAGLSCGTSYQAAVDAYDAADNSSARTEVTVSTMSCSSAQYTVRGVYDRDLDAQAAIEFNYIDSGPYVDQMDALAARGLKGFVWLGGYSNTTCTFNESDDWVRSHVAAIAGHPGVGAYLVDDEPKADLCPSAPAQMKARSDLVKSIDPGPPTFLVDYKIDQLRLWAGTVDVIGLDKYPCSWKNGCDYTKIDAMAAEADRLGIRYWGVIQAFEDDWYRMPTPEELHQEFVHWRATRMEGYLVFAWRYPDEAPSTWLANNAELQAQLAVENSR